MSKENRQRVLLVLVVAVLVFTVWTRLAPLMMSDSAGRSAARVGGGGREASTGDGSRVDLPEVEELLLADLERASGRYSPGRDPFRYGRTTQAVAPEKPKTDTRRELKKARAKQREQKAAPPSPPAPTPPPVDVVFLGSFGPERQRLAVFSDGREIYNVHEGEVLKEKFVLVKIGYESADLGFVAFPDTPVKRLEIGG